MKKSIFLISLISLFIITPAIAGPITLKGYVKILYVNGDDNEFYLSTKSDGRLILLGKEESLNKNYPKLYKCYMKSVEDIVMVTISGHWVAPDIIPVPSIDPDETTCKLLKK